MSPDKVFGLIAALCVLLWILPGVLPMTPRARALMARATYLLLGSGIVAALVLTVLNVLA